MWHALSPYTLFKTLSTIYNKETKPRNKTKKQSKNVSYYFKSAPINIFTLTKDQFTVS